MRYRRHVLMTAFVCVAALCFGVGESGAQTADEKAVCAAVQEYAKAFNDRDVKAIAAQCTENVHYIDGAGRNIQGRDALAKDFEQFFADNPTRKIQVHVESVQFIKPDVAVVDGVAMLNPPVEGRPIAGRYTAVRVKQGGKWLVASVREVAQDLPSNYEHLKELEWMVGDWVDEDEASTVRSTVRWSRNKNFLIRKFGVKAEGKDFLTGTQRIGYDASRNQIKSWVFDSEGAVFEGLWIRDGNKWIARITGVLRDGSKASGTSTYTFIDDDTFTFQSRNRVVDGEPVPDIDEVKVVRVPPTGK